MNLSGAADTSAPFADHPEIKVTTYSYVMSLMPPTIIRELNLKRHGYDVTPFGPYYQAYPDGRSIKVYADDAARMLYDLALTFQERSQRSEARILEQFQDSSAPLARTVGDRLILDDEDERLWYRQTGAFEADFVSRSASARIA